MDDKFHPIDPKLLAPKPPRRNLPKPISKPEYEPVQAACGSCPYQALGGRSPCKPRTNSNSRFLVILDQPDPASVRHGELRDTVSQKLLANSLAASGATDVSYLYVTACRRPEGASDKDVEQAIQSCRPRLEAEIDAARQSSHVDDSSRKWLLALGENAFRSVSGKLGSSDAWRGSPIDTVRLGEKAIPSWDPYIVNTAKGSRYAAVWVTHLDRYVKLATGQLGDFQWPEIVVDDVSNALEYIALAAEAGEEVSTDIETRGLGLESAISCIGFSTLRQSACVQFAPSERDGLLIRRILASGVMVGQNLAAFDRRVLARAGYKLTDRWEDTMLAASILDPQLDKNLGFLVNAEFHAEAHKAAFKTDKETGIQQGTWDSTDPAVERDRREYCLKDAYTTLLLWQRQKERLQSYGQNLYDRLKELTVIALRMRETGIYWNFEAAAELKAEYDQKIEAGVAQVQRAARLFGLENFNFQSTKQLKELYFSKFRCVPVKWTDKGEPSVDGDALTEYIKSDNAACAEFSKKLMDLRTLWKMRAVYIEGCAPDPGETHSKGDWRAHTAISGRWSCTGRPLQTVPTEMRELFCAEPGHILVEADVAALEVRSLALLSGAKTLLQMLADGTDIHLFNAEEVFKRKLEKKSRERQLAKLIFFASAYRASPDTVWRQIVQDFKDVTVRQVEAVQRALWKIHPEVVAWWDDELRACTERGFYFEPISGRRVEFYGTPEPSLSVNFPNQALGAHLINGALLKIYNELDHEREYVVSQIHDSICLSGPDEKKLLDLCHKHMVSTVEYRGRSVRIEIEAKAHKNYRLVK